MTPLWRGARPEPLQIAIVGDIAPWRWPRGWFYMLVSAPVIKPERPLHETLYPRDSYDHPTRSQTSTR